MDSDTLNGLICLGCVAGLIILAVGAIIVSTIRHRWLLIGNVNPLPSVRLTGISPADLAEHKAFMARQVNSFNQIRWGSDAPVDRQQAETAYQSALDALTEAEGDYRKFSPVIDVLVDLPRDLALSGASDIILRLSYLRGRTYIPEGVRAALVYTSVAVAAYPASVDAWIARLQVASCVRDPKYGVIAQYALRKIQGLGPLHPRFPGAEANYYRTYGTREQQEGALRRTIALAPSPVVKRRGYDGLALLYADMNRRDEAIATYQQLFREFPEGSAWTWHNYSLQLLNAKRYQEALDASNRALSFFEFGAARNINNKARKALGMPEIQPADTET